MYTYSILVKAFLESKEETVNLIYITYIKHFSTASSFYLVIYIYPFLIKNLSTVTIYILS